MNKSQIFSIFLLFSTKIIGFSYDQSTDEGYKEKYYHKKGTTDANISYFQTFRNDVETRYSGKGTISSISTGKDEKSSRISFTTSRYIKNGEETYYRGFNLEYYYSIDFENSYPMLYEIRENISKIKVTFSFANGAEKIIRKLDQKFVNGRVMWEIWNVSRDSREEFIRINLRTSDPGIENLLPKLLKHKTATIIIEVPESEDPGKLTRSITFDLYGFQRLYNKHSEYFK
ncbi:hypothetical protein QIA34_06130 (plasmid) [Borreliella yangtzensis]|uniref:DUF3108 domain-containing protein n=1 Tax=Borreliella yangtzensis TaxID=683292 RepID=A0ABR6PCX3_9SPIR|nr:hypothetical protein [Borreliella yangtzensis]